MRRNLQRRSRLLVACIVLATAATTPAMGAAVFSDLTTYGEVGWSSNITGNSADPQAETIAVVGVEGRAGNQGRRTGVEALFDLSYINYLGGEYSDRLTGNATLDARVAAVPDRLWFVVEDWFGQTQSEPFAPPTIENQENTNVLAGGIDTRLDLVGNLVFIGSGRYVIDTYQRTDADNERWQGVAGVHYEFSGRTSLGVLAQARDVNYTGGSPYDNFSIRELTLRYRISAPRTTLQVDGGRTEYRGRDALQTRRTLWSGSFALARNLTRRTSMSLAMGREISDGGDMFISAIEAPGALRELRHARPGAVPTGGAGVVATGDALKSMYLRAGWDFNAPRSSVALGGEARKERYFAALSADRNAYSAYIALIRRLSSRFSMNLDLRGTSREVVATDEHFDDFLVVVGAQYAASPRTAVGASFEHFEQAGSGGYRDRRAWVRVTYSPVSSRR